MKLERERQDTRSTRIQKTTVTLESTKDVYHFSHRYNTFIS